MYYAQMYCYGMDNNHVGITGIVGCLGAVFVTANQLYAVHIPPSGAVRQLAGANAFTGLITLTEGVPNPPGSLHLFVNGMNRTEADDEARTMRAALGGPDTKVYRIMTNLGPQSGTLGANSVVIKVQRWIGGNVSMSYKHVPDAEWVDGGNAPTGSYDALQGPNFLHLVKVPRPATLFGEWFQIISTNCHIRGIH